MDRVLGLGPGHAVLRAARALADRQDLRDAGPARPPERRRCRRTALHVRQRRAAQTVREDVHSAMQVIVGEVASPVLPATDSCTKRGRRSSPRSAPVRSRRRCPAWAQESKPLVVLIDEIDTLIGDALVSVLRQLRAGYDQRPERFPQSVDIVRGSTDPRPTAEAQDLGGITLPARCVVFSGAIANLRPCAVASRDSHREVAERWMN